MRPYLLKALDNSTKNAGSDICDGDLNLTKKQKTNKPQMDRLYNIL
jgi:hypothetical protein